MTTNISVLPSLANIFVDPKKALNDIHLRQNLFWYPLLATLVISTSFQLWYYLSVDLDWFINNVVLGVQNQLSATQIEEVHERLTRNQLIVAGCTKGSVVIIFWYLIQSYYLFFVSKISGREENSYTGWFNFVVWTSFPNILGGIAAIIILATSGTNQVYLNALDVTLLPTLLGHSHFVDHWYKLLSTIHITNIWTIGLMIFGLSEWTRRSLAKSTAIILIPYALIYLVWISYVLVKG